MTSYTTIFLDLDDTLYPKTNGVWDAIRDRIQAYMIEEVGIPAEMAPNIRKEYLEHYGTTLNGLIAHFHIAPQDYLEYVHNIPLASYISPDLALRAMILRLPQKLMIFTNADRGHAERVLALLQIADQIDGIIDILALNLHAKPQPGAYKQAMLLAGEDNPRRCLLVDDRLTNLQPGSELGMTTVLVDLPIPNAASDYCIPTITDLIKAIPDLLLIPSNNKMQGN